MRAEVDPVGELVDPVDLEHVATIELLVAVHEDHALERRVELTREREEIGGIGPAAAAQSYLVMDKINAAAKETGADATVATIFGYDGARVATTVSASDRKSR